MQNATILLKNVLETLGLKYLKYTYRELLKPDFYQPEKNIKLQKQKKRNRPFSRVGSIFSKQKVVLIVSNFALFQSWGNQDYDFIKDRTGRFSYEYAEYFGLFVAFLGSWDV